MKPLTSLDRFFRRLVVRHLAGLQGGSVHLRDADGKQQIGDATGRVVTVLIHSPSFYRHAVLGGSLSVAESYLRGEWGCDDLTLLFRLVARNQTVSSGLEALAHRIGWGRRLYHWWHRNSRSGSQRNIAAHYDLGNEFFRLWLDDTLGYSCAIFNSPNESLAQASRNKFQAVCEKLDLTPEDQVLEIGAGWGGFAVHAARRFGCKVTATTISRQQLEVAQERVDQAGLSDRVKLIDRDYRDLQGRFDKLVSIEMIEAVGHRRLDAFFRRCSQLLRPDGAMLLQAIVMADHKYPRYVRSVDFIQRYVFPGGCLPSVGAIAGSVASVTDLRIVQIDDYTPHYAETLRRWRSAFETRLQEVRQLGYSERFIRLWRYYLCYCEAAFEENAIGLVQMRLDKPRCRRSWGSDTPLSYERTSAAPTDITLAGRPGTSSQRDLEAVR